MSADQIKTSPRIDEIVLHIGLHKTGSTAIQEALHGYDRDGVRYAQLGFKNHSVPLSLIFGRDSLRDGGHWARHSGLTDQQLDQMWTRAVVALDHELSLQRRRLIFSGEALSLGSQDAIAALALRMRTAAGTCRILGYVREPSDFAHSIVQQRVTSRAANLALPVSYRKGLGAYVQEFGADRVSVSTYDRTQFAERSVVEDIAQKIGISDLNVTKRVNEATSLDATRLLHLLSQNMPFRVGHPQLAKAWAQVCNWLQHRLSGPGLRLPDELARAFATRDEVDWLGQTFGIDFKADMYPKDPMPIETLESGIRTFLLADTEALAPRLREAMQGEGIPLNPGDDALALMGRAYNHFLFNNDAQANRA